jgi:hypothetical protein
MYYHATRGLDFSKSQISYLVEIIHAATHDQQARRLPSTVAPPFTYDGVFTSYGIVGSTIVHVIVDIEIPDCDSDLPTKNGKVIAGY